MMRELSCHFGGIRSNLVEFGSDLAPDVCGGQCPGKRLHLLNGRWPERQCGR